jgi:hypothetical protein
VSSAAVLFVGGISKFSLPDQILPINKFATEPFLVVMAALFKLQSTLCPQVQRRDIGSHYAPLIPQWEEIVMVWQIWHVASKRLSPHEGRGKIRALRRFPGCKFRPRLQYAAASR